MDDSHPWDELLSKYKIPLLISLVGVVLLIGGIFSSGVLSKTFVKSTKSANNTVSSSPERVIKVDVSGAVASPGVYTLNQDSRVEEALKAAGGLKSDADPVYISKQLNLSQKVSDGMKIYVPYKGDPSSQSSSGQVGTVAGAATSAGPVSINSDSLADLDKLPGVGTVTAQKIIDGRPYSDLSELLSKKVVGKATFEKIKSLIEL